VPARLSQASTTNIALKREKFSERSATTILLFDLVKTDDCQFLLSMEVLQFLRKLLKSDTANEKYQKVYF